MVDPHWAITEPGDSKSYPPHSEAILRFGDLASRVLGSAMVSSRSAEALSTIELPKAEPTSRIVEVRLDAPHGLVDLSLSFLAGTPLNRLAAALKDFSFGTDRPWQPLVHHYARASDDLSIASLWLEFDTDRVAGSPPSIFLMLEPTLTLEPRRRSLDAVLSHFPIPERAKRASHEFIHSLPPDVTIRQLGVMNPRQPRTVRFVLEGVLPGRLSAILDRVNWQGPLSHVRQLVETMSHYHGDLRLDFDCSEDTLPNLGIELSTTRISQARLQTILELLARRGLIHSQLRPSLEAVCQASSAQRSSDLGAARRWFVTLNHLKLQVRHDATTTCKAYFAFIAMPQLTLPDHGLGRTP